MGYTHYWSCVRKFTPAFQEAVNRLLMEPPVPIGSNLLGSSTVIHFNGVGHAAHEPFRFSVGESGFCKTNQKPYDLMVMAVLALAEHFKICLITSDGDGYDWQAGLDLASRALGKKVSLPSGIIPF